MSDPVRVMWSWLLLLTHGGAALAGWWLRGGPEPIVEAAAPAVVQQDGSIIAERRPMADPPAPPHRLPAGSTELRRVSATVQPRPAPHAPADCECDPVQITMSLARTGDGTQRAVVSAEGGEVAQALDIPLAVSEAIRPRPWAAGASYNPLSGGRGAWIERDIGRLRLGADLQHDNQLGGQIILRAGITF